jgi:hypothetical protein
MKTVAECLSPALSAKGGRCWTHLRALERIWGEAVWPLDWGSECWHELCPWPAAWPVPWSVESELYTHLHGAGSGSPKLGEMKSLEKLGPPIMGLLQAEAHLSPCQNVQGGHPCPPAELRSRLPPTQCHPYFIVQDGSWCSW